MYRTMSMGSWMMVACLAVAQPPVERAGVRMKTVDDKFVAHALSGGAFEIQASQLALDRGQKPEVKKIAEQMIAAHRKCNQELNRITKAQAANSPREHLGPVHAAMLQKLGSEQGADFDECYIGMQVLAHEEALMCFRKEAKMGQNTELREFAVRSIPKLYEHLKTVRDACPYASDHGNHEALKQTSDK